jgi:diguanylate cyclase (GGDEF)-like protein/PAS domain S-box-containing protein
MAAAFVALVCVTIVASSGWTEWASRGVELRSAEVELGNLAHSLTQHAEDSLDLLDASILGAVTRLESDGLDRDTLLRLQKVLVARKDSLQRMHGIVICDENGDWLTSSGAMGGNLRNRDYFKYHRKSTARDAFIGPAVRSATNGEWITTVSRRFNHSDGSFAGVVLATIGSSYFSKFYQQFEIGGQGAITLIGNDGIVMARFPDDGSSVGRDVSDGPFTRAVRANPDPKVRYFRSALDGVERLVSYEKSTRFPFMVLAAKSRDDVLAHWRRDAPVRFALVLGLVALIAVIGIFLVRQLRRGQHMAAALAAKEANFRLIAEGSSDMVTRIGFDERISYVSPSSIRIVGWRPEQLVGTPSLAGVNPADLPAVSNVVAALKRGESEEARITYRTRHRERNEVWIESNLRVTRKVDGEIDGVIAISRDVTEQKELEGKLETLAIEDGLTGLSNRRRFDERLLEEWARAYRERTCLSLLMIDLDHFKAYNDEYGHPAGDDCLRAVARVLAAEAKRTTDIAARYGGEEFVMLLPNTDAAGCARIGERIRRELRDAGIAHKLNQPSGLVAASIGGAVCRPGTERSAGHASLVEAADRALYAAKDGGRDQVVMAGESVRMVPFASAAG